ncbi:MAG: serine/threonine-protein kinase, partial [Gemmatimonadota bacterium]
MTLDREALAALAPLVSRALELAESERDDWLARIRRADPRLGDELASVLRSESELDAREFLGGRPGAPLLRPPTQGGARVGAYDLVRPLGHGGMGSVWLARRTDGRFDGEVAIKLLNFAALTPAGAERFHREAQTLARLTHANISRLIDAGVAETGHAYLVLEYVDGTPLDQYCDEGRLAPADRLGVFRQLLNAVVHAHANLIVHCDIKPSNVLVTPEGVVKLLDFGVAKMLESGPLPADAAAVTGGGPFTPDHAAPEQLEGGPATTAIDIYALGIVLYQLLAGRHPTGPNCTTVAQHMRATLAVEPPRLSSAVVGAAARGATAERLQRVYAGDLDSILAVALQKDPARRYPTAAAFADDLDRYLHHQPVVARAPSISYRAAKFVRRNRVGVAIGLFTAATLLGATIVTSAQMVEAQRQRDFARLERDRVIDQKSRAIASSGVMNFLLDRIPGGKAFTTVQLLDRAGALIDREYRDNPKFAARMMVELSGHYYQLRDRSRQYALLRRADSLASVAHDPETAAHVNCWLGMTRAFDGEVFAARAHLARADQLLTQVADTPAALKIRCLSAKSNLARQTGAIDSALAFARSAVEISAAAGDSATYRHQEVLNELAGGLTSAGRFREALGVTRQSITLLRRTARDSTSTMMVERYNAARALTALGEFLAARAELSIASQLAATTDLSGHLPSYMGELAGEIAEALDSPHDAMALLRRARSDAHDQHDRSGEARALGSLVRVLLTARRFDEAASERRRLEALLTPRERATLLLLDAHRAGAHSDWETARGLFADYMAIAGARSATTLRYRYPHVVMLAAVTSLRAGDPAAADSLAGEALVLAHAEGDDAALSDVTGDALAVQARARGAQG